MRLGLGPARAPEVCPKKVVDLLGESSECLTDFERSGKKPSATKAAIARSVAISRRWIGAASL